MALSKEHLKRNPEERNIGVRGQNRASCLSQFNRADMLLQEVVLDICKGLTRNDIICKFMNNQYEYQKKPLKENQANSYIKMAYLVMAEDRIKEQDVLRDQLYNQYLLVYNDLIDKGNSFAAKTVLDSMSKIFLNEDKKVDVSVNGNKVNISFGFSDEEE